MSHPYCDYITITTTVHRCIMIETDLKVKYENMKEVWQCCFLYSLIHPKKGFSNLFQHRFGCSILPAGEK